MVERIETAVLLPVGTGATEENFKNAFDLGGWESNWKYANIFYKWLNSRWCKCQYGEILQTESPERKELLRDVALAKHVYKSTVVMLTDPELQKLKGDTDNIESICNVRVKTKSYSHVIFDSRGNYEEQPKVDHWDRDAVLFETTTWGKHYLINLLLSDVDLVFYFAECK
jgi:hypothetical protein